MNIKKICQIVMFIFLPLTLATVMLLNLSVMSIVLIHELYKTGLKNMVLGMWDYCGELAGLDDIE